MFSPCDIETLTAKSKQTNSFVVVKDNSFDDIIEQIRADALRLRNRLRPARMGRGEDEWAEAGKRGDSLCWVTPALLQEMELTGIEQYVHRILAECSGCDLNPSLGLVPEYSIQFAVYPGKGEGYNRHKDAFSDKPTNSLAPTTSSSAISNAETKSSAASGRQLTVLLYLNKHWEPADGGRLRVFTNQGVVIPGLGPGTTEDFDPEAAPHPAATGERFCFWGVNGYDIDPLFGRCVVFRSDIVDHAVLPCYHERLALTFWQHGTGPSVKATEDSVFQFSHTPLPTTEQANASLDTVQDIDMSSSSSSSSSSDGADSDSDGEIPGVVPVAYSPPELQSGPKT